MGRGGRGRVSGGAGGGIRGEVVGFLGGRGARARHVHQDLVQRLALVLRSLGVGDVEVLRHRLPVLAPLALQRVRAVLHVRGQVAEQQLPADGAVLWRDAGPARLAQLGQVDHLDVRAQQLVEAREPLRLARQRLRGRCARRLLAATALAVGGLPGVGRCWRPSTNHRHPGCIHLARHGLLVCARSISARCRRGRRRATAAARRGGRSRLAAAGDGTGWTAAPSGRPR